jgi:hypothetical protein
LNVLCNETKRRNEMSKNDAVLVRDEGQVQQIPANDEALIRSTLSPEDSRSQAVASFLNTAYEKASTLQLTPEESAKLLAKFDDECVLRGAGGDADLIYISHIHLSNRLNEVLGIGHLRLGPLAEQAVTLPTIPDDLAATDLITFLATTDEQQREQGAEQADGEK